MNEEEVIERLNRYKTIKVLYGNTFAIHLEQLEQLQNDIETVLNLLEKKDKIIDLMAEGFEDLKLAYFKKEDGGEFMGKYRTYNKNDWKQYFENKVTDTNVGERKSEN